MNDESKQAAAVLIAVSTFVGGYTHPDVVVRAALETLGTSPDFELLGRACYRAMLRQAVVRLKIRRADLLQQADELSGKSSGALH